LIILIFPKPRVVISRCIEFEPVRYNGQIISSEFVKGLLPHIEAITVCPEVDIGLSVPRDTLRLVKKGKEVRLIQPATKIDFTDKMNQYTDEFFNELGEVDGFILRSGSPSSGLTRVKIYASAEKSPRVGYGSGVFGGRVKEKFGHLAVEEDLRLKNSVIREHFLRKLFKLADFRQTKKKGDMGELVSFHTRNKVQLKAYSEKEMRTLGRIVANHEKKEVNEVYRSYEEHLYAALQKPPTCKTYTNVLMNSLGYFSDDLSSEEKNFFLKRLEDYKAGKTPLIVPVDIMKSWIIRTNKEYLADQSFFNPYPEELLDIDSIVEACGDRDYWKNMD
jgi:uncharacterized protein YbgA (DUF1722 family)/uncharacterized protein YbbK (DUF523 family)